MRFVVAVVSKLESLQFGEIMPKVKAYVARCYLIYARNLLQTISVPKGLTSKPCLEIKQSHGLWIDLY